MRNGRVHRGEIGQAARRRGSARPILVAAAASLLAVVAWAVPAGTGFTYQGRLKKNGNLVTGLTDFRFSLWDDPVAGNQIGSTLEFSNDPAAVGPPVQVTRGLFKVELDFGLGAFDGSERWLQIEVRHPSGDPSGFALLSQRQKVTATPYAIVAIGQSRLAASDGDPADALVVDAAGNVGIGTASPQARLDVAGSVELRGAVPFIDFHSQNDSGDFTARIVQFAPGELLRVQGPGLAVDGNVGIGTVSPEAKLDVAGSVELRDAVPFIDFHSQNDSGDFTARIVQFGREELLRVQGPGLSVDGSVGVGTTNPTLSLDIGPDDQSSLFEFGRDGGPAKLRLWGSSAYDTGDGLHLWSGNGFVHSDHTLIVAGDVNGQAIELSSSTPFIDFHAQNSSADFTARLVQSTPTGPLEVFGPDSGSQPVKLRVHGRVQIRNISTSTIATLRVGSGGLLAVEGVSGLTVNGNVCCSSDARLKQDVATFETGLDVVERLRPVRFQWRCQEFPDRKFTNEPQIGFIAQEVLEVLPELVTQDEDGYYAMDYGRLTAVLTAAVQELHQMLGTQAGRIGQAEERIETLEAANAELKAANKALRQRLDDQQAQLDALKRQLAELRALVAGGADVAAGQRDAGRPR